MKQCSLNEFMKELKPWLDKNHIRSAESSGEGQFILYFLDGMKNVYHIDDCNKEQIKVVVAELKKKGIAVTE